MNLAVNWGRREEEEQEAKESGLPESVCRAAFSLLTEKETGFQRKQTTGEQILEGTSKPMKLLKSQSFCATMGFAIFTHFMKTRKWQQNVEFASVL